jgi:transcriptional regulator with XRE-family HTH domain
VRDATDGTATERSVERLAPGQMIRSARRLARMSQREVADRAGVAPSTIGRIESAETRWPSTEVMDKLLVATGHYLAAVDRAGRPIGQHPHEAEMDRGGRYYPAHLDLHEVGDPFDPDPPVFWWGWYRIAWWPHEPAVPRWTYVRLRNEYYNPPLR